MMTANRPWNVYRTRFLVRACQLTQPLVFTDSLGREHSGRPGDYLVETSDGIRRITTQTLFEDIYVPLTLERNNPQPAPEKFPQPKPLPRSSASITTENSNHLPHRAIA